MNLKLHLANQKGLRWVEDNGTYVKGVMSLTPATSRLTQTEMLEYCRGLLETREIGNYLCRLNGSFAAVVYSSGKVYAFVDRLRSIPLFYALHKNQLFVSDSASWIKDQTPAIPPCPIAVMEFLSAGYTTNASTLYPHIHQIQAGGLIVGGEGEDSVQTIGYFRHLHGDYLDEPEEHLVARLDEVSMRMTERLISSCGDRTILLPLSGGYDSRYIAAMLKRFAYKNIICYSYGRLDSFEVVTSGAVAKQLGFRWEYVEYSDDNWRKFHDLDRIHEYFDFAFNLCSLPHIQEYIALNELQKRRAIPADAIVVPGFCGDLLGGSYVPPAFCDRLKNSLLSMGLPAYLLGTHFVLMPEDLRISHMNDILENIRTFTGRFPCRDFDDFISGNEAWFTSHKVAKFVVNSLRVYEHFGYEWRMPLWDSELMELWYRIPNRHRINKQLYHAYLFQRFFEPMGIDFRKQSKRTVGWLKNVLRKNMPTWMSLVIQNARRHLAAVPHFNGFDAYAEFLQKDLQPLNLTVKSGNINAYFASWFIFVYWKQMPQSQLKNAQGFRKECAYL